MAKRKITIDIIKQEASERGYELISDEYHGNEALLEFYCPINNHGIFHLSYHKFHGGRGCKKCGKESKKKKIRLGYDEVKSFIESQGYSLLSDRYVNNSYKLLLKCPNQNHKPFKMRFSAFKNNGQRCPECSGVKRHTIHEVKNHAKKYGYKVLSDKYYNNKTELEYKCPKGHTFPMRFNDFQQGHRCPYCKGEACSERQYLDPNEVKKIIESEGYKLKSKYVNSREFLEMECPAGHHIKMKYNDFQQGVRCDKCVREGLRGENSPNWKGGRTKLYHALRDCVDGWRIKQFDIAEHKCELTGKKSSRQAILVVHHMVSFSKILDTVFDKLNLPIKEDLSCYTTEEIVLIENKVKELNESMAFPIVMEKTIHQDFHSYCGGYTKPTSFYQLKSFCDINNYIFPHRYVSKL